MINIPKGTKDLLPQDSYKWHYIESQIRSIARIHHLQEIRTPIFEHTELFARGVGDTTDIVSKEMYTFIDKGERSITLKPEGTAGVARSYIENGLCNLPSPLKMYYITPVFRYERPQAGRLRQHHQFGIEIYGSESAIADAETISIANAMFKKLGIKDIALNINSIGCPECRAKYNAALKKYYEKHIESICQTCKDRLDKNPLRILDCKVDSCIKINMNAPKILDYICDDCKQHFDSLKQYLEIYGIEYNVDSSIVRGLDYYTKTVFEFVTSSLGAKSTVCGGGRYNNLVESVGGKSTPAVGFGMGLERLIMLIESQGICIPNKEQLSVFLAPMNTYAQHVALQLLNELRKNNISCDMSDTLKSIKNQFKAADRMQCKHVVIIGEDELQQELYTIKNMKNGEQKQYKKQELIKFLCSLEDNADG